MTTPAERLAALPPAQRRKVFRGFSTEQLAQLPYVWELWSRPEQLPPPGNWRTWLYLAGRGAGKTRSASEAIRAAVESNEVHQIGIIAPTAEALRRVCVEGPSGILAVHPPNDRPTYEMSLGRLTWPNGAQAQLFTAEEPERLRGPNLSLLWADEICAFPDPQKTWDLAMMALRLPGATKPAQCIVTTTPKPSAWLRSIVAADDTIITRSSTMANAANLDAHTVEYLQRRYAGTSLGRQELEGELLMEAEGALWTRAMIDQCRVEHPPEDKMRVVVAVDPSGGQKNTNAEVGIIVAAKDRHGHAYVLADVSARLSPERWAARAVALYEQHRADRIIAEQNYGGAMVESTIRTVNRHVPVKMIQASRGKQQRAEPVCALYEQRLVHHVGTFPQLEDQMTGWVPGEPGPSPDRLDALVWALSELCVDEKSLDLQVWLKLGENPAAPAWWQQQYRGTF